MDCVHFIAQKETGTLFKNLNRFGGKELPVLVLRTSYRHIRMAFQIIVKFAGYNFEVVDIDSHRIDQLLVTRLPGPETGNDTTGSGETA